MDKKDTIYYLSNDEFLIQLKKGVITSLKYTNDRSDTQFANEKLGFGAVTVLYRKKAEEKELVLNHLDSYQEAKPVKNGNELDFCCSAGNEDIVCSIRYHLDAKGLHQSIRLENRTEEELELTDLGLLQSCRSEFRWGMDASLNIIGHHFVGGHGSHSAYYRVDGSGPCLIVSPEQGTEVTWIDNSAEIRKEEPEKDGSSERGLTVLYPLAKLREESAVKKGAKPRIPQKTVSLAAGAGYSADFIYYWAEHYLKAGKAFIDHGQIDIRSIPGFTACEKKEVLLSLESGYENLKVSVPDGSAGLALVRSEGKRRIYRLVFEKLGEHTVLAEYGDGYRQQLYYFVTEDIQTLFEKRAAFITSKQEKDESKWYRGLFCEWNNESGVRLTPDNYDRITGWRIYEVTCDDPGLSKPAFLSSKQTILPKQEEIDALDDYIRYFVWGGLQQTTEEPYPYGIYGIPDWKQLRDSGRKDKKGTLHIWRIYDYSHIALMYYNMYRVASDYPQMKTALSAKDYLKRAYGTACALFTIPMELDDWSAYKTGLYNERVIPHIVKALKKEAMVEEAFRLNTFWMRKVKYFTTECKDVFGSEYPFDTTGFESTFYLAEDGLANASFVRNDSPFAEEIPYEKAVQFMKRQHDCNAACRGFLEPAYFCYGSDYRGNNTHYLLSYMSQMGGCSILEHALYYEEDPYEMLRLGYGSLLSSYALMNTGNEESNYGYWFPGKDHDGAAGGGFEPLNESETWLNQPSHGGSWYYSCEIDLGFCGGIRGACMILAEDPVFGQIAYGGSIEQKEDGIAVLGEDGVGRKFHYLSGSNKLHAELETGRFAKKAAELSSDQKTLTLFFEPEETGARRLSVKTSGFRLAAAASEGEALSELSVTLKKGEDRLVLELA